MQKNVGKQELTISKQGEKFLKSYQHKNIFKDLNNAESLKSEKDIIIDLKRLEKKIIKYKKNNKLEFYNKEKPHKKQLEFHKSLMRNRWVFGGNRSGKTECGAVETVWLARGNHPFKPNKNNVECWVVSLSTAVQRDVAQKKILNYLNKDWIVDIVMSSGSMSNPQNGVIDFITIKNVFGGISRIGFKSCEMGREKFQGASLDFVWFDEEPPFDIYMECKMRVVDKKGEVFGTMTPLLGLTFVYNKIYLNEDNDPNVWCIFMEWADNPYLETEEIELVSNSMSKEELSSRRYGNFASSKGLVYHEFKPDIHVIEPFDVPKEWYDNISIDPGLNNPLSAHFYACDYDGVVYVIAEHYKAGESVEYHAQKIKDIAQKLDWHYDGFNKISALIDSAASQKTLAYSKSVAELFYDNGINVNTKVNKDMFSGISRVKSYLDIKDGKAKIYIFSSCINLIREIKSYFWGENDVPKKRDDHALDELRYYIMSRPTTPRFKEEKSAIKLDKEKLISKKNRKAHLN